MHDDITVRLKARHERRIQELREMLPRYDRVDTEFCREWASTLRGTINMLEHELTVIETNPQQAAMDYP